MYKIKRKIIILYQLRCNINLKIFRKISNEFHENFSVTETKLGFL